MHGTTGARDTNWPTYGSLLRNHGYCVFALTYGGAGPNAPTAGLRRMQDSAVQLRDFVAKVRRATGARKVDLLGHSQGTLMPSYYLRFLGGAPHVKRYISLPVCAACPQMATGSTFMAKMRRGGVVVDGVDYTNIVLQDRCAKDRSEHFEIASSPVVARIVLNRLDPAHAQPVRCRLVLPYVGPVG